MKVRQATKQGWDIGREGDAINVSNLNRRHGVGGKGVAQTLLTSREQIHPRWAYEVAYRKRVVEITRDT